MSLCDMELGVVFIHTEGHRVGLYVQYVCEIIQKRSRLLPVAAVSVSPVDNKTPHCQHMLRDK